MKIVKDVKKIRRNSIIGQVASLVGLAILAGGMYISFQNPENIGLAWLALLIGFTLSQVGIFFGNRWGRRPRPDEHLDSALKGMDDRHTLYHYAAPTSHLLLGPSGIWVFLPRHQTGKIIYQKGRFKQKGGGILQGYLRLFAQEGMGRPDLELEGEIDAVKRFIKKKLPETEMPEVQGVMVFTSEKAELEIEDAPILAVPAKKLKELVRKSAKEKALSPSTLQAIQEVLPGEAKKQKE
jgi:hypothetical protein